MSSCSGDDPTVTNGTVTWCCAGLSIDLLEILKRRLEFDYDLFEVPDRTCGVKNQVNCTVYLYFQTQVDFVCILIFRRRKLEYHKSLALLHLYNTFGKLLVGFSGNHFKRHVKKNTDKWLRRTILFWYLHTNMFVQRYSLMENW